MTSSVSQHLRLNDAQLRNPAQLPDLVLADPASRSINRDTVAGAPLVRQGLDAIANPGRPDSRRDHAIEVASEFESLFAQIMVQGMRESADSLGEGGMFSGGVGSDTYAQWFDQHMSQHLTNHNGGNGLGVVEKILEDLVRHRQLAPTEATPAPDSHYLNPEPPRLDNLDRGYPQAAEGGTK